MTLVTFILTFLTSAALTTRAAADPVAAPESEVVFGKARFTILTERLVRLEWSDSMNFEDRASLAVINRRLPKVQFTVSKRKDGLCIRTSSVEIRYSGQEKFNAENLSISFDGIVWHPGDSEKGNLGGTIRTLDGCSGYEHISKSDKSLEKGILSRDGWSVLDESGRPLFEKVDADWENVIVENPCPGRVDWYFFAYGHDYKQALKDYTSIAGRIPLPPKYAFGYWWSRYWDYTDDELIGIARDLRSYGVPSDVFVIDMGWHKYWEELLPLNKDEFGQRIKWTGYSWNRKLIRDPEALLKTLHDMHFKTSLNLHPASGIRPIEDCYEAFRKDYLSRTDEYDGPKDYVYSAGGYKFAGNQEYVGEEGKDAPVPFRLEQRAWADAYFNSVLHPIEKQGVDFWWLDWQQWVNSKYSPTVSNTFLCNYMFWQDKVRSGSSQRPMIYHRWGGVGSHRYQLGFSGDTYSKWSTLKFIPYFTATASNVCYGYWGHDIGGHMLSKHQKKVTDPELFTRWLQSGVFTPIFKTHSTESVYLERKIWKFPSHFEYMRDAIRLRYALSPYIYTAARQAYDTGLCICRPLYYEHPEKDEAYSFKEEYFFGPDILAVTVCEPADTVTGLASAEVWFPEGNDWYDMASHCARKAGTAETLNYSIRQNPWYVKAGAIIPMAGEGISNLQENSGSLRILVIPGETRSSYCLYEDDGHSNDYDSEYALTLIEKRADKNGVTIEISPRKGEFDGCNPCRSIEIILEGWTANPDKVTVNGRQVPVLCHKTENAVSDKAISLSLPEICCSRKTVVKIFAGK